MWRLKLVYGLFPYMVYVSGGQCIVLYILYDCVIMSYIILYAIVLRNAVYYTMDDVVKAYKLSVTR